MALNFLNDGYFAGKVGIGTETPLGVLEVAENGGGTWTPTNKPTLFVSNAGTSNSYYALGIKSNSGDIFAVTNAGNVGIGVTAPSEKLEVNSGSIFVNGENNGIIVDSVSKRVGLMKYSGHEGVIAESKKPNV